MNEPEGFPEFWKTWAPYQRKTDGRGKARPAYKQMIDVGHVPADIIDGARWYVRNLTSEDERRFIPLASTWLRSERFADDCEKERNFQASLANRSNVTPIKQKAGGE